MAGICKKKNSKQYNIKAMLWAEAESAGWKCSFLHGVPRSRDGQTGIFRVKCQKEIWSQSLIDANLFCSERIYLSNGKFFK